MMMIQVEPTQSKSYPMERAQTIRRTERVLVRPESQGIAANQEARFEKARLIFMSHYDRNEKERNNARQQCAAIPRKHS
jgi:hypothetical protein